jgi:tetratricopeptide (TPR) repeat protein
VAFKKLNIIDSLKIYETKLIGHCYKPWDKNAEYRNSKLISDVLLRAKEAEMARKFLMQTVKILEEIHFNDADYIDVFLHDINYLYYQIACTYALENKLNEAIEYIEKAIDAGYIDLEWMLKDPDLVSIQKSKKFKQMIRRKQEERKN